jgi:hypothetical protein
MTKASQPSPAPSGGAYSIALTDVGICCAAARDFIVVGGLDSDPYSIRWNAIGDPTDWPVPATDDARSKQAGSQTLKTRHGVVTAIAGNDFYMYVFQVSAITKGTYVGGDVIWAFDTFEEGRGCITMGHMVQVDDTVFFESLKGFHRLDNDVITDIGFGKVDDSV